MKKLVFFTLLSFAFNATLFAWGQTGHRIVGEIAWQHLNKKAKKNVQRVLGTQSLAMCGNYMDFIKSESSYDSLGPWHYCTILDNENYSQQPPEGDVIMAITKFITELETKKYSVDEAFALKCLVHLVGDIHQPLHVGNGADRGGNDIKVEFFYEKSNLHRVWDSDMIDHQQLSYTEYSSWINVATQDQIALWQKSFVSDWANESKTCRSSVYSYPENGKLSYRYIYDNISLLNQRLLQAGVRLAAVVNKVYE